MELPKLDLPKFMLAGTGEKAQYLVHDFNDNTIRFVLHYSGLLNRDTLSQATKALVGSLHILHSSFIAGKVTAHWRINKDYEETDYFTYIETTKNLMELALENSLLPIEPSGKTQLHCTLVQDKSDSVLIFRASHLCVDGSDGKYLLGKLAESYHLIIKEGNADRLELKHGSRMAEQIYKELSPKEYFSLMKNPISTIKTVFPFPTEEKGEPRITTAVIPADTMAQAKKRGKETGATVNDILLTALYHAYVSLPDIDDNTPMSIMSMMDLRQHCKNGESEGLCNMSGSLPTVLETGIANTFEETLAIIANQTKAAKENPLAGMEGMPLLHGVARTIPMGLLLQAVAKVYGSMAMGFTNLGMIDCNQLKLENITPDTGFVGGPLKKKAALQVCTGSFNGIAALSVVGEYTEKDKALIQILLDRMVAIVTEYGNHSN